MKKAMSLILVLALCLALAVPALAVESTTAKLTPEAASAYQDIVDGLYREYGAPADTGHTSGDMAIHVGMCGGYIVDLGDGGCPELVVACARESKSFAVSYQSCVKVYTWNGTSVGLAYDEQVLASGNGRSWPTYTLCQNENSAWLDLTWEYLPSYDYSTGQMIDGGAETEHYRMENGEMKQFTPQTAAASSAVLGSYDYIGFANYDELKALLANAAGSAPSGADAPAVTVNSEAVVWADAAPFIDGNGRTMVPLRAVADAMKLTVSWDADAREAAFTDGSRTIYFPIGSTDARTSGGGNVQMDTAAVIVSERTYAPIRYLAEFFGHEVGWDDATRTVTIK